MEVDQLMVLRRDLRRLERMLTMQEDGCCSGVTLAQCHTLLEMEQSGPTTTTGALAVALSLDKSTLSRTIDQLVKSRHISRKIDPKDRRYTILKLTEKGRAECDSINTNANGQYGEIFATIPQANHDAIANSLSQFLRALTHYYQHNDILDCDCEES
ncbi:MarR family winged helix-turn-helix transcriptional regulator [Candidatus Neomarinimicrobiota bacterium]